MVSRMSIIKRSGGWFKKGRRIQGLSDCVVSPVFRSLLISRRCRSSPKTCQEFWKEVVDSLLILLLPRPFRAQIIMMVWWDHVLFWTTRWHAGWARTHRLGLVLLAIPHNLAEQAMAWTPLDFWKKAHFVVRKTAPWPSISPTLRMRNWWTVDVSQRRSTHLPASIVWYHTRACSFLSCQYYDMVRGEL